MKALNPYLTFNGNALEAFNFYKSVFGGEFAGIMKYSDIPDETQREENKKSDLIVHIALPVGDNILMGMDMPATYPPANIGNNFHIAVSTDSEKETDRICDVLSAGGNVMMKPDNTFWGAYFAMLTDKYGVQWMISYDKNRQ